MQRSRHRPSGACARAYSLGHLGLAAISCCVESAVARSRRLCASHSVQSRSSAAHSAGLCAGLRLWKKLWIADNSHSHLSSDERRYISTCTGNTPHHSTAQHSTALVSKAARRRVELELRGVPQ